MPVRSSLVSQLIKTISLILLCVACTEPATQEKKQEEIVIKIYKPEVENTAGFQSLSVTASSSWTISIHYEGESRDWVRLEKTSGQGSEAGITVSWDENESEAERKCEFVLSSEGSQASTSMTQLGGKPLADIVPGWLELPSTSDKSLTFITHDMKLGDGSVCRNYSYFWDEKALVAHWVAYPLNAGLLQGGSGRTDEWGLDPKLPRDKQPVLFSGYGGFGVRGHQIPSADRQIRAANVQTFYGVNMTPQNSELNSGTWAKLEERVRSWARSFDTLYVVTGCTIEGSVRKAYDNDGKEVTVPTGYYKALLGYKKSGTIGQTLSQGGYTAVAFYYPNQNYSGSFLNEAMTVDQLEAKTGVDFFVNLPAAIGNELAAKVEATKDNYWWK